MLARLVYVSTADPALSSAELETIHHTAQARNARLGLSGLLLYTGSHFMQLLEGEQGCVRSVFESICSDPRHRDIVRLVAEPARERACPGWSMAMRCVSEPHADPREVFRVHTEELDDFMSGMPADLSLLFKSFNTMRWSEKAKVERPGSKEPAR